VETPDNEAGRETEQVMAAITEGQRGLYSTEKYNRCYEAVYALLSEIDERTTSGQLGEERK